MRAAIKRGLRELRKHAPRGSRGFVPPLVVALAACGTSGGPARSPDAGAFHVTGAVASADPTVRTARLLPETVDEKQGYGTEPGGGVRAMSAGLRVVTTRDGSILAADDRLPQVPQSTVALPERLGGGFLFVLGTTVWRADHWLDPARPIFASYQGILGIIPGLDRVYVRMQSSYLGLDGKTGRVLDLGPWPASPLVLSFAAADGWRAAAVTDLRGAIATFDAGATWRTLDLPMTPGQVVVSGDSLVIGGTEGGRTDAWFEVRGDGAIARLSGAPREAKSKLSAPQPGAALFPGGRTSAGSVGTVGGFQGQVLGGTPSATSASASRASSSDDARDDLAQDAATRIFGKRPLATAIEDGWPLTDGTVVLARDGALGRVRLSDGALVELVPGAFPLKPARCHPMSLTRPGAAGAFGFVCGEPRGATAIYAYDAQRGLLHEMKRFDRPRIVTPSGSGAIAVRGPCAADGDPNVSPRTPTRIEIKTDAGPGDGKGDAGRERRDETEERATSESASADVGVHTFCVYDRESAWREVHVRGDVGDERVVVLADGKLVVLSPPAGQAGTARLTVLDHGRGTTVPITFPKVTSDIARVLRLGVWLDGFEERRAGVVGGWIEAGGAMLGIEVALDGKATAGQFVRDAGLPFVSGRYGFGWTSSRRGYETTDGGMTWKSLDVPDALVPITKVERRACGPVGCLAAGWLRVGWGETKPPPTPAAPAPYRGAETLPPPQLALVCEPTAKALPVPPAPKARPAAPPPIVAPRVSFTPPPVLGTIGGIGVAGVLDLPPFMAQAAPWLRDSERGVPFDVRDLPERHANIGTLGRIYAWGPKTGDWDTQGKWQVKWLSPFAGWPEAHSSAMTTPPQAILDFTKTQAYGYGYPGYGSSTGIFQLATGDDSGHALLLVTRPSRDAVVPFELETDRVPLEVRRADGEPFPAIEGSVRAGGRWFFATPPSAGGSSLASIVWQVDGGVARELVRVPRAFLDRAASARLARRSDGRAIGLVVEGQATAERNTSPTRWVLPIDLESGQLGEPELLGYADLADRTLEACGADVLGWVLDASLSGAAVRVRLPSGAATMHGVYARVRLTPKRACVERLSGTYGGAASDHALVLASGGARMSPPAAPGEVLVAAIAGQGRYNLRCAVAK